MGSSIHLSSMTYTQFTGSTSLNLASFELFTGFNSDITLESFTIPGNTYKDGYVVKC